MPVPQPRRVTVWWFDAHGDSSNTCIDEKDILRQHKPTRLALTGWLVHEDEIGVSVAQEWFPREGNEHISAFDFRCAQFRPRGGIERIEYLDEIRYDIGVL